jgi:MFS family permease
VATTGAIVSEFAPPGKKNLCNAITYSGVPLGSLLAALLAILLLESIGWRGMFWIGALPLVTLLPLAFLKMPESPAWLASRGRLEQARAISEWTGVRIPEAPPVAAEDGDTGRERAGFAGLFSGGNLLPTVVLGLMSALGLLLVYSINTWLPELTLRAGFNAKGSLSFLLVSNGGAVIGALIGSRVADRLGPKPVVASCFLIGAISIVLLTLSLPLAVLLLFVAVVGLGTSGTRPSSTVSWRTTTGPTSAAQRSPGAPDSDASAESAPADRRPPHRRGPGHELDLLCASRAAFVGMLLTLLVPVRHTYDLHRTPIEPSAAVAAQDEAPSGRPAP